MGLDSPAMDRIQEQHRSEVSKARPAGWIRPAKVYNSARGALPENSSMAREISFSADLAKHLNDFNLRVQGLDVRVNCRRHHTLGII